MCNNACIEFGEGVILSTDVLGKKVIEVGSQDINGTLRESVKKYNPARYLGVDIVEGKNVDEICSIHDLQSKYGEQSFDLVLCTEVMEHVKWWQNAINNLKHVCSVNGVILLTTRSPGFGLHNYPEDFWRYTISHLFYIFEDFNIEYLSIDPTEKGVFIKARKPENWIEKSLDNIMLYQVTEKDRK